MIDRVTGESVGVIDVIAVVETLVIAYEYVIEARVEHVLA